MGTNKHVKRRLSLGLAGLVAAGALAVGVLAVKGDDSSPPPSPLESRPTTAALVPVMGPNGELGRCPNGELLKVPNSSSRLPPPPLPPEAVVPLPAGVDAENALWWGYRCGSDNKPVRVLHTPCDDRKAVEVTAAEWERLERERFSGYCLSGEFAWISSDGRIERPE